MPPTVIKDSDDEGSDLSPAKITSPRSRSSSESKNSTGFVAREADLTHRNLMFQTSSHKGNDVSTSTSVAAIASPTMSKIKRRQTTMDQVSGQQRKSQKLFGSSTTLDDLGLNRSHLNGEWLNDDDEVELVLTTKRKRASAQNIGQTKENIIISGQSLDPDALQCTLSDGDIPKSSETKYACSTASQMALSSQGKGSVSMSQIVNGALSDLHALPDSMVETSNTGTISDANHQGGSIEVEQISRSDISLEEPTFEAPMESVGLQTVKVMIGLPAKAEDTLSHNYTSPTATKHEIEADTSSNCKRGKVPLAKEPGKSKPRGRPPKETTEKIQSDDLESDDINLPKESYKPRPSRSRKGEIPDNFIASIDFSVVPEKAAKRKSNLKRNKTTSDIPVYIKDDGEEDDDIPFTVKPKKDETTHEYSGEATSGLSKLDATPKKRKRGRPKKEASIAVPERESPVEELAQHSKSEICVVEIAPPEQKKRGRKKKGVAKAPISGERSVDENAPKSDEESIETGRKEPNRDSAVDGESEDELLTASGRKGKRLKVRVHVDDEGERAEKEEETKTEASIPQTKGPALRDKTSATNSGMPYVGQGNNLSGDADGVRTPKKAERQEQDKGPGRHSPLSSGQVRYRVGLSRRARIEPLLRVVRK